MKGWVSGAVIGLVFLVGCSSTDESSESQAPTSISTSASTTEAPPPSISGTVTIRNADDWNLYPLDWMFDWPENFELPESIHDGDVCRSSILGGATFIHTGTQIVAKDSSGEIVGIGRLGDGSVEGLGSPGFDVPTNPSLTEVPLVKALFDLRNEFRDMRIVSECVFPFTIDLTHESPFYTIGIERADPDDQRDTKYTHDELESVDWVISFVLR